ncbi:MAG: ROK family transcriptional regulator [Calditrichaeota bacterium]|nr:ROK family transcriptional regulator [Calditrichota bacterium]RQW07273.1 MAG: ROK family transcriptional regulator [Calditrichota bacterium]
MDRKANSKLIKELNEFRILNLIREHEQISRIELANQTTISKVAISDIVNRLVEAGYVMEIGKGESTERGGKRPTLIRLNPESSYVIGIDIKRKMTHFALANIESHILGEHIFDYNAGISFDTWFDRVVREIDSLLTKLNIDVSRLTGIGIGIPGIVNYQKGYLHFADTLTGWGNIPISDRFTERFGITTILENDVNAMATGEHLAGAGRNESNLICIWIGAGIGAGIIVDNHLIRGNSGSAGEIGYLELGHCLANREYLKNLYANQHYFGEILREEHLYETLKMKLQWNSGNTDKKMQNGNLKSMLKEGDRGNPAVQEVLDEYAFLIAVICTNLLKTMNPNLVILSGNVVENSDYLLQKVRQLVKQQMLNIPFQKTSIVIGELGNSACITGAVNMALRLIFEPPLKRNFNHSRKTIKLTEEV